MFGVSTATAERWEEGFQYYTFEINPWGIKNVLERGKKVGEADALKRFLCGQYMRRDRPEPEDVTDIQMIPGPGDDRYTVTLKIKRGHLRLREFMKVHVFHGSFTTQLTGRFLAVACVCGEVEVLDASSIR